MCIRDRAILAALLSRINKVQYKKSEKRGVLEDGAVDIPLPAVCDLKDLWTYLAKRPSRIALNYLLMFLFSFWLKKERYQASTPVFQMCRTLRGLRSACDVGRALLSVLCSDHACHANVLRGKKTGGSQNFEFHGNCLLSQQQLAGRSVIFAHLLASFYENNEKLDSV